VHAHLANSRSWTSFTEAEVSPLHTENGNAGTLDFFKKQPLLNGTGFRERELGDIEVRIIPPQAKGTRRNPVFSAKLFKPNQKLPVRFCVVVPVIRITDGHDNRI
jgi:hypothetical protein